MMQCECTMTLALNCYALAFSETALGFLHVVHMKLQEFKRKNLHSTIEQLIMGATLHSHILQVSVEAGVSGLPKSNGEGLDSTVTFPGSDLLFHCLYLAQNLTW